MDGNNNAADVVLLLDNYSSESQKLHQSFVLSGCSYPTAVIQDDGFLPENVMSVYGYFLGNFKDEEGVPGHPLYFNQIKVPEYWEISGNNSGGAVHDLVRERGKIFYAEPLHKRLVKVVDWYDERGVVRYSDHYNRYGALYARTIFNAKGQKVNKSYFSAQGREIIVENFVTGDIILNYNDAVRIFRNKTDFVKYFLDAAGLKNHRLFFNSLSIPFFVSHSIHDGQKGDVLFWQEPVGDGIPGNMRLILDGNSPRVSAIMVQNRNAYNRLIELGASESMVHMLGFIYPFHRDNMHRAEVLICTNSDRIEQCRKLAAELPQVQFHIAALTEMSSKLMSMSAYENVHLYPGVKSEILKELFEKCDIYLDINYGNEIVSAVYEAFLNNQIIYAFKETMHNGAYIAGEHVYPADDVMRMISDIKQFLNDGKYADEHLKLQHEAGLSQKKEDYIF